jgi:NADPH:quinone reductase-like Zn-dependent oxidoreductase
VVATASTRSLPYASQFGADQLINYNEVNWWDASITCRSGFDFIFDAAGEALGFEHAQTSGLVKTGGVYISIANFEIGFDPSTHQPEFSHAAALGLSNSSANQVII